MGCARGHRTYSERLAETARGQHGVFSRDQALECGLTSGQIGRRVRDKEWQLVAHGVYRVSLHGRSWHQDVMAKVLWAGHGAVASHRTAAALWELDGFQRGPVEVSVPTPRYKGRAVHRTSDLTRADVTRVESIPVTTPARTLIDLGAVVPVSRVEESLETALRTGLTSVEQVRRVLDRLARRGRPGLAAIRAVLERRPDCPPTDSVLETRFVQALREAGLPEPVRQHQVRDGDRVVARLDLAYPEHRLFVELDGWSAHSGRASFVGDRRRQNQLVAMGWQPLRFTWEDLTDGLPAALAVLRAALAA